MLYQIYPYFHEQNPVNTVTVRHIIILVYTPLFLTNKQVRVVMPVPRALMDQIRQIIPPLNGKLHKGQSGMSAIYSPYSHPSHMSQAG